MATPTRDVSIAELMKSIQLPTGAVHVLRVRFPQLHVRLPIDPSQAESWDDRFVLTMKRGSTTTRFVQTVKDDQVPGDKYVDLIFENLMPDGRYTLVVEPGAGEPAYTVFEDQLHDELFTA